MSFFFSARSSSGNRGLLWHGLGGCGGRRCRGRCRGRRGGGGTCVGIGICGSEEESHEDGKREERVHDDCVELILSFQIEDSGFWELLGWDAEIMSED